MRRITFALLTLLVPALSCNDSPRSSLKGQSDAQIMFYGKTVDQSGEPLEGVHVVLTVLSVGKEYGPGDNPPQNVRTSLEATSDANGRFHVKIQGLMMFIDRVEKLGYRHFYDMNRGRSNAIDNTAYTLISWGDACYKSDPDHPAVYVLVKDGVTHATTLPCAGGSESANGVVWRKNEPGWPTKPSLKDVTPRLGS
ncbi:MAG TPA: hypothetical protein VF669_00610 [Tepidisphaeraceae bacterium]|jgi:hypothetical protein